MIKLTPELSKSMHSLYLSFLFSYLLLVLINILWSKSVSNYLNLSYLLAIVVILFAFDIFINTDKSKYSHYNVTWKDYAYVIGLGILGLIIIKFKTAQLGWLSWVIAIIAAALIILISYLILEEDEQETSHSHN